MGGGGKLKSSFKTSLINVSRKKGFTLAEVLITLAIIGVVAAMTIPAVIVNTNQAEFKTGLRKAVSVLNSAITLNKALTGESPYDNENLYLYLQQHMAVIRRAAIIVGDSDINNLAFYTSDGMRFELTYSAPHKSGTPTTLYEDRSIRLKTNSFAGELVGNCGSMGLAHNPDGTTEAPCLILVDVNGDRKPTPSVPFNVGNYTTHLGSHLKELNSISSLQFYSAAYNYSSADPNGRLLKDIFPIMITDQGAIPYGVVAQKAMYQAQK